MTNLTEETAKELISRLDRILKIFEPQTMDTSKKKTKKELELARAEEWGRKINLFYIKKNLKSK